MTEFKKHRARHIWRPNDTGVTSCTKCGKVKEPNPETVVPPDPKVE